MQHFQWTYIQYHRVESMIIFEENQQHRFFNLNTVLVEFETLSMDIYPISSRRNHVYFKLGIKQVHTLL